MEAIDNKAGDILCSVNRGRLRRLLLMIACTLSNLELRSIIEGAFLPSRCNCTVIDDTMTVEVIDPRTERVELLASGIKLDSLDTSRALCDLILKLRADLQTTQSMQQHALAS
ncbi:DUF1652 domain-containing protein [Pseudomonas bohemica]|uniref:DUF1652 domain-containing protein n=1 Tax=Pseudomonas bohemica TaxID=2044872 RepID=UPI002D770578|nr:DUF1652 domain-containing protein [Pseudomonas bohemica]